MVSPSNLLSLALLYVCVLFGVAWYADRKSAQVAAGSGEEARYLSVRGLRLRATTARGIRNNFV